MERGYRTPTVFALRMLVAMVVSEAAMGDGGVVMWCRWRGGAEQTRL